MRHPTLGRLVAKGAVLNSFEDEITIDGNMYDQPEYRPRFRAAGSGFEAC
ncbi:hypothetical protein J7J47_14315 [Halomonas sp. ISL-60]|nr:hypothetical protein [Halomonas sp. ISL-60]MBT2802062.1 hypothetical protein [Halomonas sp. ISL-56]